MAQHKGKKLQSGVCATKSSQDLSEPLSNGLGGDSNGPNDDDDDLRPPNKVSKVLNESWTDYSSEKGTSSIDYSSYCTQRQSIDTH